MKHNTKQQLVTLSGLITLLLFFCTTATVSAQLAEDPNGSSQADNQGFLWGTVSTNDGNEFTGFLRWDGEEAFWDDLFNSGKRKLPHAKRGKHSHEDGQRTLKVLGKEIKISWGDSWGGGRQFVCRFGDIKKIEVLGNDEARLTMRDGQTLEVEGVGNDVRADVHIADPTLGGVDVKWKNIRTVVFNQAPRGQNPGHFRLHGRVETDEGTFTGPIQWDAEECLSTDELDGESGDTDLSIPMGNIRSIAKKSRRASTVELKDGRVLTMEGTNDVDDDNRGILIEDARFGRVEVQWDAFRKATFENAGSSGKGFNDHGKFGPLRGTVEDNEGNQYRGEIVYDLDERYGWEMLDGEDDDISYSIPMGLIQKIEPRGEDSARITLRTGETVVLEDGQDVSDRNDGILILDGSDDEGIHVRWRDLRSIVFEG